MRGDAILNVIGPTLKQNTRFSDLFYDSVDIDINPRTECKLSVLRIESGEFILDEMFDYLSKASIGYVLSRREYERYLADLATDPNNAMAWAEDIKAKFQEPNATNGEGGEMILYALLEEVVGAPKILSKMEIKTNNKMPVFGADGLHLLRVRDDEYQLVFGESKMHGDLGGAISKAFESMSSVKDTSFRDDTSLVSSQLMKEAVNDEQLKALEAILIPEPGATQRIKLVNSFGVLVTFDLDVDDFDLSLHDDDQIETEFRSRAQNAVQAKTDNIQKQIRKYQLGATNFHIFAIPFLKRTVGAEAHGVDKVRKDLQHRLRWGKG